MGIPNIGGDRRRGYTVDGDFIEINANCSNCGRGVELQDITTDIDSDAARFQAVCLKCHDTIFRIAVTIPDPLDDVEAAL